MTEITAFLNTAHWSILVFAFPFLGNIRCAQELFLVVFGVIQRMGNPTSAFCIQNISASLFSRLLKPSNYWFFSSLMEWLSYLLHLKCLGLHTLLFLRARCSLVRSSPQALQLKVMHKQNNKTLIISPRFHQYFKQERNGKDYKTKSQTTMISLEESSSEAGEIVEGRILALQVTYKGSIPNYSYVPLSSESKASPEHLQVWPINKTK